MWQCTASPELFSKSASSFMRCAFHKHFSSVAWCINVCAFCIGVNTNEAIFQCETIEYIVGFCEEMLG